MNFDFHSEAESEFLEAIDYYEECETGLGFDFSIEVYASIQNSVSFPTAWPEIEDNIRRCLIQRFPYGILYSIAPDKIFILAVMHLHRDPSYWKHRR